MVDGPPVSTSPTVTSTETYHGFGSKFDKDGWEVVDGFGLSEGGGASISFPERSVGVGLVEEGRVPSSGYASEGGYSTSGPYPTPMEDDSVLEDVTIPKKTWDSVLDKLENPPRFGNRWDTHSIITDAVLTQPSDRQIGGNHYKDMPIQPSEYITKNGLGWYEGNAIKYISRYKTKHGRQDIEKAIHYLELLLETLE